MLNRNDILELVENYKKLVNTQDKSLFDDVFAMHENCNLIAVSRHFQGRESIYNDFLIGGIRAAYSHIELISDGIDLYEINDNLVNVVFKYHTDCIRRDTNEPYGIEGIETQVIIKEHGQWKILHVHYSKV